MSEHSIPTPTTEVVEDKPCAHHFSWIWAKDSAGNTVMTDRVQCVRCGLVQVNDRSGLGAPGVTA